MTSMLLVHVARRSILQLITMCMLAHTAAALWSPLCSSRPPARSHRVAAAVAMAAEDGGHVTEGLRVIMKFGGSSVRDAERITEVCQLVQRQIAAGVRPHLVCSAMGKTTAEVFNFPTALVQQFHKGGFFGGLGQDLHEQATAAVQA